MIIEVITRNTETGEKRTVKTITNNGVLEHYLSMEKGVLEHGTNKLMKMKDVFTLAGYAALYLHHYKEPPSKSSTGITDTDTRRRIDEMRTTKEHAQYTLSIAAYLQVFYAGSTQVALRVK